MNDQPSDFDSALNALFARARAVRPDTGRAEYAFETRLVAHLRATPAGLALGTVAWRLLPYFALIVLVLGAVEVNSGRASQEAARAASLQNPETTDLFATFQ